MRDSTNGHGLVAAAIAAGRGRRGAVVATLTAIVAAASLGGCSAGRPSAPALGAAGAGSTFMYTTANDGSALATIDLATGDVDVIGATGFVQGWALAVGPDGTLYTVINGFSVDNAQLATIDPVTAAATPVGTPWGTDEVISLVADAAGTLYAGGFDGTLYTVDTTTGQLAPVGDTGVPLIMDFAFDSAGTMWMLGDTNRLHTVDPLTAESTLVTTLSGIEGVCMGLVITGAGTVYTTSYTSPGHLYDVDAVSGAASEIGLALNTFRPHGGELVPPPAPCPADIDADGEIGFTDLLEVLVGWGFCTGCPADIDGDGEVGFTDLLEVLVRWGLCSG